MDRQNKLSIVVNFHNMRREAKRTLLALTAGYQRDVGDLAYEVIALDNGSTEPLGEAYVRQFGGAGCRYLYVETDSVSPATAMNQVVASVDAEWVMCLIDGARMPSPGVVRWSMQAARMCPRPFVYTLAMHLGAKPQNDSMLEGYDQAAEDRLLETVDWQANGYALFGISCCALSSSGGFFSKLNETNCFMMRREDYLGIGGYSEEFISPGGGFVNLDFFRRVHERPEITPVMLLGEATFHQFHGGVATNVPRSHHPVARFAEEYRRIRGCEFLPPNRPPVYLGTIPSECRTLICNPVRDWAD